jgi:molybdopterin molybdotransferase
LTREPTCPIGQPSRPWLREPATCPIGQPSRHSLREPTCPIGQPSRHSLREPTCPIGQALREPATCPIGQPGSAPLMHEPELDIADAQRAVLTHIDPLPAVTLPLTAALGRVLAADLQARWALPGAAVATMDGWALRSADLLATDAALVRLQIAGESAAGHPSHSVLRAGQTARISTGAVIPPGADAVVAQEDCSREGDALTIDRGRVGRFAAGHFVRAAGSDVAAGALLLSAGAVLGAGELALLAGCGHTEAPVHRPPRLAILGTGDELVPIGATPGPGQVVNSNALMLACQARAAGAEVIDLGIARDDVDSLRAALRAGLDADLLVTCGGISVGDHDLVLPTLLGLGGALVFRRVRLRPGRPSSFLRVPTQDGSMRPVFALPGNPASAHVAFELFVRPALLRMQGRDWQRARRSVTLTASAPCDPRRAHVIRARVVGDRATPLPDQTSGALRSIAGHNALIELPPGTCPMEPGASAMAILLHDS